MRNRRELKAIGNLPSNVVAIIRNSDLQLFDSEIKNILSGRVADLIIYNSCRYHAEFHKMLRILSSYLTGLFIFDLYNRKKLEKFSYYEKYDVLITSLENGSRMIYYNNLKYESRLVDIDSVSAYFGARDAELLYELEDGITSKYRIRTVRPPILYRSLMYENIFSSFFGISEDKSFCNNHYQQIVSGNISDVRFHQLNRFILSKLFETGECCNHYWDYLLVKKNEKTFIKMGDNMLEYITIAHKEIMNSLIDTEQLYGVLDLPVAKVTHDSPISLDMIKYRGEDVVWVHLVTGAAKKTTFSTSEVKMINDIFVKLCRVGVMILFRPEDVIFSEDSSRAFLAMDSYDRPLMFGTRYLDVRDELKKSVSQYIKIFMDQFDVKTDEKFVNDVVYAIKSVTLPTVEDLYWFDYLLTENMVANNTNDYMFRLAIGLLITIPKDNDFIEQAIDFLDKIGVYQRFLKRSINVFSPFEQYANSKRIKVLIGGLTMVRYLKIQTLK